MKTNTNATVANKTFEVILAEATELAKAGKEVKLTEDYSVGTKAEIVSVLMYEELKRRLADETTEVVIDALYQATKSDSPVVNYYRVISKDKALDTAFQLRRDGSKDRLHFSLSPKYTESLKKSNLAERLRYHTKNGTITRTYVDLTFDEAETVYADLKAVLASAVIVRNVAPKTGAKAEPAKTEAPKTEAKAEPKKPSRAKKPAAKTEAPKTDSAK